MASPSKALSSPTPTHLAYTLLRRAQPALPDTATTALFTDKIVHKPLLLRPSDGPADKRALRRHVRLRRKEYYLRKQKPRPLSAKEKRALGVYALDKKKGEYRYAVYEGLWRLWVAYMWKILDLLPSQAAAGAAAGKRKASEHAKDKEKEINITPMSHGSLLASADFHGAKMEVLRAGCVDRVGIKGVVVRETKFTFVLVTERDEVKTVPKRDTVLRYEVPLPKVGEGAQAEGEERMEIDESRRLVFELQGNQFEVRPADRANKKFKWRAMGYL